MLLRTRRPVRRFVMVVCAIIVGGWLNNLRMDRDSARSETSRVAVEPGWVAFAPSDGGFTVMMPAKGQLQHAKKIEPIRGGMILSFKVFSSQAQATTFSMMYADESQDAAGQYSPDELLAAMEKNVTHADADGYSGPVDISGVPGREVVQKSDGKIWHYRMCVAGNRCFVLLTTTQGTSEPAHYLEWFFDSFKIDG
ncbi:MAG TPA: hypothetical protein VMD30_05555 [Tepidisphaeraceae bacterium]|nr:hypothetical protein [Tepidisphaeraceae bacterium]